jgi:membrane-associated protein
MPQFFNEIPSVLEIIQYIGLIGIYAIIFAESGLFFGFFLPGDSLLFTAGLLASQGYFSIVWLIVGSFIAAVVGDTVGYHMGKYFGLKIFVRENSFWFNREHPKRAQLFYEKYGPRAIILARFIPIVRTFVPIVAGVGSMNYKKFLFYNVIGGALWTVGIPLLGYFLGRVITDADRYILPIVLAIIAISFIPVIREYIKSRAAQSTKPLV